jgi:MscS family membrane protein
MPHARPNPTHGRSFGSHGNPLLFVGVALLVTAWATTSSAAHAADPPGSVSAAASSAGITLPSTTSEKDDDRIAADSPRASMGEFFDLCRAQRFAEAARYLQFPKAVTDAEAQRLTERLDTVLRRHIVVDKEALSPESMGDKTDGNPDGVDEVGKVPQPGSRALEPVRIVRRTDPDGNSRWVFSKAVVERIDRWYDALEDRWLRDSLPAPLLKRGPKGVFWWQWIATPLLFALTLVGGRILQALTSVLGRRFMGPKSPGADDVWAYVRWPVLLGWSVVLFEIAMPVLALDRAPEQVVDTLLRILAIGSAFWGLIRTVRYLVARARHTPWAQANPAAAGLLPLFGRIVQIALFVLGLAEISSLFGVRVASIVAGLGIGGLAVALAAQKTVENLFGAASLGLDEPFRIGDYVTVDGGTSGTIESLGLRSTRIRTVERTVVTIPNSKLADMRIENFAPRDRFRLQGTLVLATASTADCIASVVDRIREAFQAIAHPNADPPSVAVRQLTLNGAEIEYFGFVRADSFTEFVAVRHTFTLEVLRIAESSDARWPAAGEAPKRPGAAP